MSDDFEDFGLSTGSDFSDDPLDEVESTSPEFPSPSLVTDAMIPEVCS